MPLANFSSFFAILCLLLLAGCVSGPAIDRSYSAVSQDSRVRYVILHYTHGDLARSFRTLTEGRVSSHYLLSDRPAAIYQLVDEDRRAWHAGDSAWNKDTQLNFSSIGIELVNGGYADTPQGRLWHPYTEEQITLLIDLLKQIVARHRIAPEHILGHSDIAPGRKVDPGPLFPWERLARAGLIRWPDPALVARLRPVFALALPDAAWFQRSLRRHGYALAETGQWDDASRNALAAFQMKYRPTRFDGMPDEETAAMLEALATASGAPD
ncbi:N-acetylmuramoyl-L-alanine amidase [Noviherbaspirillum aridicola]|uniref:N-acetylmuramoyl-L-alanine amidase n=1 Tax=Noviherbaspirillum aridicola TaxID=2849687 RepID=A0ABQ4PZQ4_9BURK|nr:N-acetylmuramoyl-L-alanine amidase [Noviherbaspirillum aridicola]GIZ50382.1 protein AmpDh2 [Noviherbaspirillum aridicola]